MTDLLTNWRRVDIGGRPADALAPLVGEPAEAAVIFLHGHGEESLASDAVFTDQLVKSRLPCVCPRGGVSWWLDQKVADFHPSVTPMDYVREQVVGWIGREWGIAPPRIGLMGISMGGQGVLQLAYRDARRFPVVAAISPAIDFHRAHGQGWELDTMFETPEAARQQTATLQLHPLNWPVHQLFVCDPLDFWHSGCETLASKLSSMGIPYESDLETSAGGHGWEYFHTMAPRCVQFIADSLREVIRRQHKS